MQKEFCTKLPKTTVVYSADACLIKYYAPLIRLVSADEKMETATCTYVEEQHIPVRLLYFKHNFLMQVKLPQAQNEAWSLAHR